MSHLPRPRSHPLVLAFVVNGPVVQGATAYRFRIPPEAFNNGTTTPANIGFWANGPNGVLNVSACEFKAAVRSQVCSCVESHVVDAFFGSVSRDTRY
jgi:hypothetical protein